MHDYTLGFGVPWWVIPPTLAAAIGLSLWAYGRSSPLVLPRQRLLLLSLRTLFFLAVLLALWQPVVGIVTTSGEEPRVAILLDNSASMRLREVSGNRAQRYREALSQLSPALSSRSSLIARFDATVTPLERWHPDSLSLDGPATDIGQALRWVASEARYSSIGAVLLLSDGVVTAGGSPLPDAEALGLPIVTVLVGDTTSPADLAVQSVLANPRIPLGSQSSVSVLLTAEGFEGQSVRVELWEDSRRIGEELLQLQPGQRQYMLRFPYRPQQEGMHRLRVRLQPLAGEATLRNNEASTFVDVVRMRYRLLLFAGSPSPDVAFLRRELQRNPLLELSTFIHKDATSFYEGTPSEALLRQADAFLFLDFPLRSTPEPLLKSIAEQLARGRPLAWFAGPQTDREKLRFFESVLPVGFSATPAREFLGSVAPAPNAQSHPLLRLPAEQSPSLWNQLPPVFGFSALAHPKPTAEVLATLNAGSLREPFLVVHSQPTRSLAVLGYGLYRWKLMGYAATQVRGTPPTVDLWAQFVDNLTQWLLESERERFVQIRTTKRFYAAGETVQFWASVSDPNGNPVENATVRLVLTTGTTSRELFLRPTGEGTYQGQLSGLPAGDYAFRGEALLGGQPLGSDRGVFSIGDAGLEERSLRADAQLLRTLAQRTGGAFFPADSAAAAWQFLKQLPTLRPVLRTLRRELLLWSSPWLLALALGTLTLEWTLRRRWGLL